MKEIKKNSFLFRKPSIYITYKRKNIIIIIIIRNTSSHSGLLERFSKKRVLTNFFYFFLICCLKNHICMLINLTIDCLFKCKCLYTHNNKNVANVALYICIIVICQKYRCYIIIPNFLICK